MDLRWPLRFVEERRGDIVILVLTGRIGAASAASLAAAVSAVIGRGHPRVVLDLEGVDYVSSAGLTAIEEATKACRQAGGTLVLCRVAQSVRIGIELGGLADRIRIEPSRDQAVGVAREV